MTTETTSFDGGCACRFVRFRMTARPMFVHCCHCTWCQRESGSAFALNALVESEHLALLEGEIDLVDTPTNSGKGQKVARCPRCQVAVWSHYGGDREALSFVRVGTLDQPGHCPPDIHIFTESKQPWMVLPSDATVMPQYYRAGEHWSAESLARREAMRAKAGRK